MEDFDIELIKDLIGPGYAVLFVHFAVMQMLREFAVLSRRPLLTKIIQYTEHVMALPAFLLYGVFFVVVDALMVSLIGIPTVVVFYTLYFGGAVYLGMSQGEWYEFFAILYPLCLIVIVMHGSASWSDTEYRRIKGMSWLDWVEGMTYLGARKEANLMIACGRCGSMPQLVRHNSGHVSYKCSGCYMSGEAVELFTPELTAMVQSRARDLMNDKGSVESHECHEMNIQLERCTGPHSSFWPSGLCSVRKLKRLKMSLATERSRLEAVTEEFERRKHSVIRTDDELAVFNYSGARVATCRSLAGLEGLIRWEDRGGYLISAPSAEQLRNWDDLSRAGRLEFGDMVVQKVGGSLELSGEVEFGEEGAREFCRENYGIIAECETETFCIFCRQVCLEWE